MMAPNLEAIRARNEERKNPQAHRGEGCFSSVAYDESAFGTCGCYDALAEVAPDDIDALLAEVERLTSELQHEQKVTLAYRADGDALRTEVERLSGLIVP